MTFRQMVRVHCLSVCALGIVNSMSRQFLLFRVCEVNENVQGLTDLLSAVSFISFPHLKTPSFKKFTHFARKLWSLTNLHCHVQKLVFHRSAPTFCLCVLNTAVLTANNTLCSPHIRVCQEKN